MITKPQPETNIFLKSETTGSKKLKLSGSVVLNNSLFSISRLIIDVLIVTRNFSFLEPNISSQTKFSSIIILFNPAFRI